MTHHPSQEDSMTEWATSPRCHTCNDSDLVEVGPVTIQCPEPHRTTAGKVADALRGLARWAWGLIMADELASRRYAQVDAELTAKGL